jgi:hypothetical protein
LQEFYAEILKVSLRSRKGTRFATFFRRKWRKELECGLLEGDTAGTNHKKWAAVAAHLGNRLAVCLFQINKISDHQEYYRSCRDPRNDQTRNGKRYYPRQHKNVEKKPFGEVENKAERSSAQNNIGEDVLKL